MNAHDPYRRKVYYGLALDPIHVGTGGYRLGEVDLTIVREPGSNLPKIPGSSLAGSARAYTAMRTGKYRYERYDEEEQKIEQVSCAGKGGEDGSEHCGEKDCPVCTTYGFTIGKENRSFHGLAQFYDAQILFFPVHSMVGPVWVTSPQVLAEAGYNLPPEQRLTGDALRVAAGVGPLDRGLNLGWLFLQVTEGALDADALRSALGLPDGLARVAERLALVPDHIFPIVVDSNLEVRTSVSIDPATGAAEDKALFTYEALPRGTVLRFPIVYHNPQHYVFPVKDGDETKPEPFPAERDFAWVQGNVEEGLKLMEYLGVGGMSTRGFGRLRVLEKLEKGGA
ncbi:MAG TPA: type III-B CRISPR module RAMP protein Cmr4 [Anaerolineae bacterium]|nr:type III-B CRISPR module RAMP protein Cmr4 [Anaerolineae bacterium]